MVDEIVFFYGHVIQTQGQRRVRERLTTVLLGYGYPPIPSAQSHDVLCGIQSYYNNVQEGTYTDTHNGHGSWFSRYICHPSVHRNTLCRAYKNIATRLSEQDSYTLLQHSKKDQLLLYRILHRVLYKYNA